MLDEIATSPVQFATPQSHELLPNGTPRRISPRLHAVKPVTRRTVRPANSREPVYATLSTGAAALVHYPPSSSSASTNPRDVVIMAPGLGGGIKGPSNLFATLAAELSDAGVVAVRVDYLHGRKLPSCILDLHAALEYLDADGRGRIGRVILFGWSFGGAVSITTAVQMDRVVAVALVAPRPMENATDVAKLGPANKALLVLHGTLDSCIAWQRTQELMAHAQEPKEVVWYENDNHGLNYNAVEASLKLMQFFRLHFQMPVLESQ